jgi:predicted amidophosphoribosyltransferase
LCYISKVFDSLLSLKDLIYPRFCLSCHRYGDFICLECEALWLAKPRKTKVLGIDHFFTEDYNENSTRVILAAKESGNKVAVKLLANAIARSIKFAVLEKKFEGQLNLVTIPSQKNTIRSRGRNHISDLASQVVIILSNMSLTAKYFPLLGLAKKSKDQSNLNSRERLVNMKNAFIVNNSLNSQDGIFLIDDLITTGASIMEGVRAVGEAKITVNGIITACAVGRNSLIR